MKGRTKKSIRNFNYGLISQFANLILGFIVRAIFIKTLGVDYLGINGLFTNILTVLSLAELGIGTAMVYSMYRPLADNDEYKLQALMNLYKKLYTFIGFAVAIIGLLVIPLFPYILKDAAKFSNITVIYILFLANSVSSYFFIYKKSILEADQKIYIYSKYHLYFIFVRSLVQIISLFILPNFILYLAVQVLFTLLENIYISRCVDKLYPFLKNGNTSKVEKCDLDRIKRDVGALVLSNISRVAINGTANIIISAVVGITAVGLYSNYTLIIGALVMILSQISVALTASVGNYIATESNHKHYELFNRIDLLNFWLYSFCGISFVILSKPFISLWIGSEYVLDSTIVIIIALNFIIEGMLQSLWTFRTTMGLFTQGKYRPVFAAIINIFFAYILGRYMGLVGVLLGTTISRLCVNMWYDPYIIFKHGFNISAWKYLLRSVIRLASIFVIIFIIQYPTRESVIFNLSNICQLIILALVCFTVINLALCFLEFRNPAINYYCKLIKSTLCKHTN